MTSADQAAGGTWIVDTPEKAKALLPLLYQGPAGLDTETVGVDPTEESPVHKGRIACWSVAFTRPSLGLHSRTGNPLAQRCFLWADMLPYFTDWLEDPMAPKVGHNIFTFDRHIFLNHAINLQGIVGDTLRMSKLGNANKKMNHGLKNLMWVLLGYSYGEYKELFSRPMHKRTLKVWEKTVKKEKVPVDGKYTKRKVLGGMVPTWAASGEHFVIYKGTELIPLDTIERDYPQRLEALYEYASLDAKATLELWYLLKDRLERMPIPEGEAWL